MNEDNWHYPRPELAAAYLQLFELGLSSARGLFARRRMGKTEFLKKDFIPAAREKGYLTAYVNLWDNKDDPGSALVGALYQAMEVQGWAKLLAKIKQPVKKVKASGEVPGVAKGAVEADLADDKALWAGTLLQQALVELDKKKKRLVLIVDEAQVLASEKNGNFTHALRAALDVRKDQVKVLFAGSSENTLRSMFGRPSEPFYNWAVLEPFNLLGQDFVAAMVEKVAAISRYPLALDDALRAFAALGNTPEFFRSYLERYLTNPLSGADAALLEVKAQIFGNENFQSQWDGLLPADRTLLEMIAAGTTDLYSKESLTKLGQVLGLGGEASKSTPLNSLQRLTSRNLVTKVDYGKYQVEDTSFAQWILQRDMG